LSITKTITRVKKTLVIAISVFALLVGAIAHAQSIDYDGNEFKIALSEDVQAAIDSGVSLTFENELAHSNRWAFFHWHSHKVVHRFIITRHTLSNRYLLHQDSQLTPRIFSSTRETMAFIGETAIKQFADYHEKWSLDEPSNHKARPHRMRLRLSKTKLPGPMRLTAFITSAWNLNSGWKSWQSDQ